MEQRIIAQEGIGPLIAGMNTSTKQTTATPTSLELKKRAMKDLHEQPFLASQGGDSHSIHVNDLFDGLKVSYENVDAELRVSHVRC